jgi:hypothetical protein
MQSAVLRGVATGRGRNDAAGLRLATNRLAAAETGGSSANTTKKQ